MVSQQRKPGRHNRIVGVTDPYRDQIHNNIHRHATLAWADYYEIIYFIFSVIAFRSLVGVQLTMI